MEKLKGITELLEKPKKVTLLVSFRNQPFNYIWFLRLFHYLNTIIAPIVTVKEVIGILLFDINAFIQHPISINLS